MIRGFIACLIVLIASLAQAKKSAYKYLYKPLNVTVSYQAGTFLTYGEGNLALKTRVGQGAEITLKTRVTKKLSFNLGIHARSFVLDEDAFVRSLNSYYTVEGYYTSIYHYKNTNDLTMSMFGLSPSVSKIYDVKKTRFEPYIKFNTSFISYSIDSRVYFRNIDSNEYYFFQVNGKKNQFILLPAIGLGATRKMTKAISFSIGFETGFSVGKQLIRADYINKQYQYEASSLSIATPKVYLVGSAGITFRPFNRLSEKEKKYHDEKYLKRFEKNQ